MRSRRAPSFSAPHLMALLGALMVLVGFFLPWLKVQPTSVVGDLGSMLGSELGIGDVLGNAVGSLVIEVNGWNLATGITMDDLVPSKGWGALVRLGAAFDPEAEQFFSQRLTPPMVWLFVLPLLALIGMVVLLVSRGEGAGVVSLLGVIVLILVGVHIILFYVGVKGDTHAMENALSSDEALFLFLSSLLIEVKLSVGMWLSLIGSMLWVGGGLMGKTELQGRGHTRGRRFSRTRFGSSNRRPYSARRSLRSSGRVRKIRRRR